MGLLRTITSRAGIDTDDGTGRDITVADCGGRALEIDAVRGWAALSVVCFHVFWETFGIVVPALRNRYTSGLIGGHFDVILFFILSGDALSYPFFHGGGAAYIQRAALKRYFRLTIPIVVVTAATAILMATGLTFTGPAGDIVGRPDWLGTFARFNAAGGSALKFAFFHVYAGGGAYYMPFLWTMPIEMMGSLILFLVMFVYPRIKGGCWLVAGGSWILVSSDSYIGCFLAGMLLGQARAEGLYDKLPRAFGRLIAPIGVTAALAFVGHRQVNGDQQLRGLALAGSVVLFCVYANRPLVRLLSRNRFSQFLGRISFMLYLWHFTVLVTLTSFLIVQAADEEGTLSIARALGIGVATVILSLLVARWTLPVEDWARRANAALVRFIWRDDMAASRITPSRATTQR